MYLYNVVFLKSMNGENQSIKIFTGIAKSLNKIQFWLWKSFITKVTTHLDLVKIVPKLYFWEAIFVPDIGTLSLICMSFWKRFFFPMRVLIILQKEWFFTKFEPTFIIRISWTKYKTLYIRLLLKGLIS